MRALLLGWLLAVGVASVAPAQPLRVRGRAVRITPGGPVPLAGAWVTLHRIAGAQSGPIDSMRADGRGRYDFSLASPDTVAIYLATTRVAGIAYFAPPVHTHDLASEGLIEAFDTTSVGPPLRAVGRHLVVSAANANGSREIMDITEVANEGIRTRIGSLERPAFLSALPTGATNVRATQGDFTGEAARVVPAGLAVLAPFAPGVRQLAVSYQLPATAFPLTLQVADSLAVLEVLLEDSLATVAAPGLQGEGRVESDGRTFSRYLGRDLPGPIRVAVTVPASEERPVVQRVGVPAALALLALAGIAWTLRPRRRAEAPPVPPIVDRAAELRAAIAGVDATLASTGTSPASVSSLNAYRASLAEELEMLLAAANRPQ